MGIWIPDTDDCIIEFDGKTGEILGFVEPSQVHATPEEVLAENQRKNSVVAELEREGYSPDDELDVKIDPTDRAVVVNFLARAPSASRRTQLQASLAGRGTVRLL